MLCKTCQQRFNCIPAAFATNDSQMRALLERLQQCERYAKEEKGYRALSKPQPGKRIPLQHPA
ncbi:MAG: hypothetical protein F6K42_07630 [Leptolyngbya sp. SIO1D8]|nr:hypothetical protein [Leptolyngbya sp. SIO1D8]